MILAELAWRCRYGLFFCGGGAGGGGVDEMR